MRSLDLLHFDAILRRVCYFGIHVFPGTSLEIRSSLSDRFDVLNARPPTFLHPSSSPPVSSPRKWAHTQVLLSAERDSAATVLPLSSPCGRAAHSKVGSKGYYRVVRYTAAKEARLHLLYKRRTRVPVLRALRTSSLHIPSFFPLINDFSVPVLALSLFRAVSRSLNACGNRDRWICRSRPQRDSK